MIEKTKKAQAAATAYAQNIFVKIFSKDDCNILQKLNRDARFLLRQLNKEPYGSAAYLSVYKAWKYAEERKKQFVKQF